MKYLIIALLNVVFFNFILCRSICDPSNSVDFSEELDCKLSLSTNISQDLKTGDDCLIRDAQGACVSYKNDTPPSTIPPPPTPPASASASATAPATAETPATSQAPVSPKSAESSGVHFDNKWIIAIVAAIIIIAGVAFCIWKPRYAQENCHCMC
ncbi:hypothetical protein CONCODRAFT_79419 [Conidiobolus coronatus NRRL 28638]|uniref:Mid2 domain-containing protein n=1 Tax=Conidiobolus coronatus (strain ATCC 28846 / CBS 209.66 / NRRL 28638) TaxID=796925 RepID=A0A137P2J9_CONC2|nr:hypothetical protein CONCODRAFT_79419 [Conidiobolus coronatus NRRL 28638]|eukprot:KXN69260.1 hypothetical protein CONCODRAFT_79419 [Conidiobolus coronatus NRRL 28638]